MKTAVNIGVREVKMLEVIAATEKGDVNFGNFSVESEWEGLTKLKSVKTGSSLVVRIEKIQSMKYSRFTHQTWQAE